MASGNLVGVDNLDMGGLDWKSSSSASAAGRSGDIINDLDTTFGNVYNNKDDAFKNIIIGGLIAWGVLWFLTKKKS